MQDSPHKRKQPWSFRRTRGFACTKYPPYLHSFSKLSRTLRQLPTSYALADRDSLSSFPSMKINEQGSKPCSAHFDPREFSPLTLKPGFGLPWVCHLCNYQSSCLTIQVCSFAHPTGTLPPVLSLGRLQPSIEYYDSTCIIIIYES